jgi:hypothetical protein
MMTMPSTYKCHNCESLNLSFIVGDGHGKLRYVCKDCGKSGPPSAEKIHTPSWWMSWSPATKRVISIVSFSFFVGISMFVGELSSLWVVIIPIFLLLVQHYFEFKFDLRKLNVVTFVIMMGSVFAGYQVASKVYDYAQVLWKYESGAMLIEQMHAPDATSLESSEQFSTETLEPIFLVTSIPTSYPPTTNILTPQNTPTSTPEPIDTPAPSDTPIPTETVTPETTDTPVPTETITPNPTDTSVPTVTVTPEPTDTHVPTETVTPEPTDTPVPTETYVSPCTPTPTETPLPTETSTPEPTDTPVPTDTVTPVPSDTPVPTDTVTPEPTETPVPTETVTPVPSETPSPTETVTPEPTDTPKPTETVTPVPSDTPVPTDTVTPEPTNTPVPTDTVTPNPTDTPVPTETPPNNGEACSPGYWKNHLSAWIGYIKFDDFDATFGVDFFNPDISLKQSLYLQGGAEMSLARQGTAALLNAAHPKVNYPLTATQVIALVQAGDVNTLEGYNNKLVCPLHNGDDD